MSRAPHARRSRSSARRRWAAQIARTNAIPRHVILVKQMAARSDQWYDEIEGQQRLLAKQLDAIQQKLGAAPAEADDVDLPAAEYARNFIITIAVCVYVCAFQGICSFSLGGREGNASQIMHLFWPICWTMLFALTFGALDSSAAGRRALQLMRAFAGSQIVLAPLLFRESRFFLVEAAIQIILQGVNAIFYPWFGRVTAEVLRKRGSRKAQAEHYTKRALKVLGFQILLVVSTIALGVDGPRTYWRVFNAETFSITRAVRAENRVARDANNGPRRRLTFGWVYLIAIFDVCAVDGRAATKLRLSPLEAAALVSTGLFFLSGLACYSVEINP